MSARDAQAHFVQFIAIAHLYTSSAANRRADAGAHTRARRKRRPAAPEGDEKNFSRSAASAPISTRFAQNCATLRGCVRRASATQLHSMRASSCRKIDPDRHPFSFSSRTSAVRFSSLGYSSLHAKPATMLSCASGATTPCAGRGSCRATSRKDARRSSSRTTGRAARDGAHASVSGAARNLALRAPPSRSHGSAQQNLVGAVVRDRPGAADVHSRERISTCRRDRWCGRRCSRHLAHGFPLAGEAAEVRRAERRAVAADDFDRPRRVAQGDPSGLPTPTRRDISVSFARIRSANAATSLIVPEKFGCGVAGETSAPGIEQIADASRVDRPGHERGRRLSNESAATRNERRGKNQAMENAMAAASGGQRVASPPMAKTIRPRSSSAAPAPGSVLFAFDQFRVGIRIEQLFGFLGQVGRLDHEDPAFTVGILVDRLRLVGQCAVDRNDLAGNGCIDV
jgi:hypothetical protein